LTLTS